jgi:hypothetical protein
VSEVKRWVGRLLHDAYQRAPVSMRWRLAIKDMVFRWLAPLLRNTNSYRRWIEFRSRSEGSVREAELRVDARWQHDTDTLFNYVGTLMRQPLPSADHVAISTQPPT